MLRQAVEDHPGADGIVLASHGLFTWGATSRECYLNTSAIIDDLGTFVLEHQEQIPLFGGPRHARPRGSARTGDCHPPVPAGPPGDAAARRSAIFDDSDEALEFVNARDAEPLAEVGTSCPDHFVRTRIKPLLGAVGPGHRHARHAAGGHRAGGAAQYRAGLHGVLRVVRDARSRRACAIRTRRSCWCRASGMFAFGANRREAGYTAEFYRNAIRVMAGATALGGGATAPGPLSQPKSPRQAAGFTAVNNYVALPGREAFNIEYWALEEAKLQRMPPPKEFSRRVCVVVGGGSGIGRAAALEGRGARRARLCRRSQRGRRVGNGRTGRPRREAPTRPRRAVVDITSRESIRHMLQEAVRRFGGIDIVINTAAVFPSPDLAGRIGDEQWQSTFALNVTANYLLADEAAAMFDAQKTPAAIVLTSSANAVVPKKRQRGVRRQQERGQPSRPRTGHPPRARRAGQRDRAGHGGDRLDDVPARPRDVVADEVRDRLERCGKHRRPARQARAVLREPDAARPADHAGDCAPRRFSGSPASAAAGRRVMSSRWTAGCRRRSCAK